MGKWQVGWLLSLFLVACSLRPGTAKTAIPVVQPREVLPVVLPPGQVVQAQGDQVLFMGARIQHVPGREVVLFDRQTRRVVWRATLPGSAVRAVTLPNGDWVVVTTAEKRPAHLLRLEGATGAVVWDQAYAAPALDALWWNDAGLLVTDGREVWQVDARDGRRVQTVAQGLGEGNAAGNALLARSIDDPTRLYVVSDRLLLALDLGDDGAARVVWRFRSPKFIAEMLPLRWARGEAGVWVGAHSYAYWVNEQGQMRWRWENQDINYAPVALPNARQAQWVVFGNYVKGLYIADAAGVRWHVPLPEGSMRVLGIPLPIPRHVLLGGIAARPMGHGAGYWLAVRSLDALFVLEFVPPQEPRWVAKAEASHAAGLPSTMMEKMNAAPNYPPLWWGDTLVWSTPEGLALVPWDGR